MVGNVDPKIHSNKNRNNLQKYFLMKTKKKMICSILFEVKSK